MNILIEGYLDRNFGDDVMIRIVACQLSDCKFFIKERKKEMLLPFAGDSNIYDWDDNQDIKIDLVLRIIGSGFMITSKSGMYYCVLNILSKLKLKKKGLPMAVIGCNVGPFSGGFAKWLTGVEMRLYDLFTVRESFSYNFISKRVRKKPVYCFPDIVFSLPDEWLPPNTGEGCLGISSYRMQCCSNLSYYTKIAEIADEYIEKQGKKVLLFAFDVEGENDLAAAYTIKSMCRSKDMVEIIPHDDDGSNIINNMARCSFFVPIRLHSCIMSIKMGIPFTPIIYSKKTDLILDDLGYGQDRFYISNFETKDVIKALSGSKVFEVGGEVFENAKKHSETIKREFVKGK
ncbi:MAG: polysaccharide pyruvyl transferase family protein [Monoglobales bacterium]